MKKLLTIIFGLATIIGLAGCGKVSLVKDGTLAFDKSLTIGQAFDNYQYFDNVKWEEITTDNGKKVVQVNAIIDLDKHPKGVEWKKNIKEMKYIFQFTINQDETFQLSYGGIEAISINDEKNEINANNSQLMQNLKEVYGNVPLS
jgi:hypothetical protein